jgi:DUF1680 family protein
MAAVFTGCPQTDGDPEPVKPVPETAVELFSLRDVRLEDGPFKKASDLNIETLLQYDVDRLLAPFLKEAGLTPKGALYDNWGGVKGLDGHVGGHYLSAIAITAASTGDQRMYDLMDYMLEELEQCQNANGDGYLGGVPNGKPLWNKIKNGDLSTLGDYWVPWYNIHKIYAGLRDAWLYGGRKKGKDMFLKLCDWGMDVINGLNDEQMETMLNTEYGGMNEVYADAYEKTGNADYLETAKRFSHKRIFNSMVSKVDNLNGEHANTTVPKAVGYAKVAYYTEAPDFTTAADYFWDRVVNYRSVAFGGNSLNERFRDPMQNSLMLEWIQGPETCNTYNMLKLTETLFRITPQAKHADYYERALYNHILASQNPQTGGYVYFTPLRPEHYRVYSTANLDMWCCVGTGMENHGKYGAFIYAHTNNTLYVNLFIASTVQWKDKGVTLTQTTNFPDEETAALTVNMASSKRFKLRIRYPWWIGQGGMTVSVGGKNYAAGCEPDSYVEIDRVWNDGDTVDIQMPMDIYVEDMENVPNCIAIMRGPILLCAETETESSLRVYGDGSRMGHEANGLLKSASGAPVIVGEPEEIIEKLKTMEAADGAYTVPGLTTKGDVVLKPFFRVHEKRYMMYWVAMTEEEYERLQGNSTDPEDMALANRSVDSVMPGEQQSEAGHNLKHTNNSESVLLVGTGAFNGEYYRNSRNGAYFEYEMDTEGRTDLSLMVRYWGNEGGENRTFDINIDGQKLVTENLLDRTKFNAEQFFNVEYPIPAARLQGKTKIVVRFTAPSVNLGYAGNVFYIRLLKPVS